MSFSKNQIVQMMEALDGGQVLLFQLSPTFGSHFIHIRRNPPEGPKGGKKFVMQWGKTQEAAQSSTPFLSTDKPKKIAAWVAEREPALLEGPPALQKAV